MRQSISIITSIFLVSILLSCIKSPHYQKTYTIKNNQWDYSYKPSFKFEISDTTSFYNLYFIIRHTETYPYSNIWMWVYTKKPGDTSFSKTRIEIPLAETGGKWLGRGMGTIWEQHMPISATIDTVILRKKGVWEISFEQNMRINPLPEVMQVGLRIEKR